MEHSDSGMRIGDAGVEGARVGGAGVEGADSRAGVDGAGADACGSMDKG
jgi:hypothetical protein